MRILVALIIVGYTGMFAGWKLRSRQPAPECSDLETDAIAWKIREEWGSAGISDPEELAMERESLAETMNCKLTEEK